MNADSSDRAATRSRPRRAALHHRRQRRRRQEHADRPPAATTASAILDDQLAARRARVAARGGDAIDLSLLTDGLEAEREQGITIDVAYRYFATPQRKFIIADAPGHEQYTRNMVTGASHRRRRRHPGRRAQGRAARRRAATLTLAHLLGIRHIVVAVNKMDLVGLRPRPCSSAIARRRARDSPRRWQLADVRFIPVSALRGDMVVERGAACRWYTGPTLLEVLEDIARRRRRGLRDAAALSGAARVAPGDRHDPRLHGPLESGVLAARRRGAGAASGRRTRRERDRTFERRRARRAAAGDPSRCVLRDEIDISRGDMLVDRAHAPRAVQSAARATLLARPRSRSTCRHATC